MRILRHTESIHTEIKENTDQDISNLLTRHVDFAAEYHDPDVGDLLIVFIVEPGDTLATIDRAMNVPGDKSATPTSFRASRALRSNALFTRCSSSRATRATRSCSSFRRHRTVTDC